MSSPKKRPAFGATRSLEELGSSCPDIILPGNKLPVVLTSTQCAALRPGVPIGRGTMASVFERQDSPDQVVKFTTDEQDATASREVLRRGGSIKGAVRIQNVVHVLGPAFRDKGHDRFLYGIVAERVAPLSELEQAYVTGLSHVATDDAFEREPHLSSSWSIPKEDREVVAGLCRSSAIGYRKWAPPLNRWDGADCTRVNNEVFDAVEHLAHAGIALTDAHGGNFGRRKSGELVALDLGFSGDEDTHDIPELAGVRRGRSGRGTKTGTRPKVNAVKKKERSMSHTPLKWKAPRRVTNLGASESGSSGLWWVLGAAAAAGVWLFTRGVTDAQASTAALESTLPPVQPAPVAADTSPAPSLPTFSDPATGVAIAGPATPIQPAPSYTVQPGESWSNIASRTYGDYRWWPFLWDRNRTPTMFVAPDDLRVSQTIVVSTAPPTDAAYQDAIFARAVAHRAWWLAALKNGVKNVPPMGPDILTATPLPVT